MAFPPSADFLSQPSDCGRITLRPLQKSAVPAQHLFLGIARYPLEGGICVYDRIIRLGGICHQHSTDDRCNGAVAQDKGFLNFFDVGDIRAERDHTAVARPVIGHANPTIANLLVRRSAVRLADGSETFLQPKLHIFHALHLSSPVDKLYQNFVDWNTYLNHIGTNAEHGAKRLIANYEPLIRAEHDKPGVKVFDGIHQPLLR